MLEYSRKKRLRNISLVLMIVMIFNLVSNLSANYVSANEMGINYTLFSKNNIVINNYKTNIQGNIYAGKDLTYTGEEKHYEIEKYMCRDLADSFSGDRFS